MTDETKRILQAYDELEKAYKNADVKTFLDNLELHEFEVRTTWEFSELQSKEEMPEFTLVHRKYEPSFYAVKYPETLIERFNFTVLIVLYQRANDLYKNKPFANYIKLILSTFKVHRDNLKSIIEEENL